MHGMIASEGQSRDDGGRSIARQERIRRQRVADDAIVAFCVERAVVQADARAAMAAARDGFTKPLVDGGLARARRVLQRDQEPARVGRVVAIVFTGPGVYINHSARRDRHVPRVTDAVGEDRRAKTRRQLQAAVIVRACGAHCSREDRGTIPSRENKAPRVQRGECRQGNGKYQLVARTEELHGASFEGDEEKQGRRRRIKYTTTASTVRRNAVRRCKILTGYFTGDCLMASSTTRLMNGAVDRDTVLWTALAAAARS